jgi:hypothetical protein
LSYSFDGKSFKQLGSEIKLIFQLKTFQGIRYSLFAFGSGGGHADFTKFTLDEPTPRALTRPIPFGKTVTLQRMDTGASSEKLQVIDRKLGRVALKRADGLLLTVNSTGEATFEKEKSGDSQTFQWMEVPRGDLLLMSLANNRYLTLSTEGTLRADARGAQSNRKNGASFNWTVTP